MSKDNFLFSLKIKYIWNQYPKGPCVLFIKIIFRINFRKFYTQIVFSWTNYGEVSLVSYFVGLHLTSF